MVWHTLYVAEEIVNFKWEEENGDITEIRIYKVQKTKENPEGISYSCVFIRNGKRAIAYDNFEGHKGELRHHKHINERITPYQFIDEWTLIEDFNKDIEKLQAGEKR
jgi:hypothetical protein